MSAPEISPFPLVELQAVSNAHNEWVALTFEVAQHAGDAFQAALTLLKTPDVFAALAPLDCILPVPHPHLLEQSQLETLPNRIILRVPAAACADVACKRNCPAMPTPATASCSMAWPKVRPPPCAARAA
jgi:EAL and modified HD-GYP domain-containing signal transduction protein